MNGICEQLCAMGILLDECLDIRILFASNDVHLAELNPTTAEMKTLVDKDVMWEDVNATQADQMKNMKKVYQNRSHVEMQCCAVYNESNHYTDKFH